MALTAALKAQIGAWYKALQQQIPDFIPRAPQRQMIADVAKTLAGDDGRHLAIEAPTGVGKTLSYLIPGIAIAREDDKTLVVSTANVALQDQIFSKDLPLLRKIIPDLRFTAAFGRGRYVCPRNLAALASSEPSQQDLLAFLDDELTPNNKAEQEQCAKLKADLDGYRWDGLRDHTSQAIGDDLWRRLSTDKASCLNRNCHYYRECPFFVARREIQEAEVVVANHALVMAALESEAVLPEPKNLLLVLDEGHHLPDVVRLHRILLQMNRALGMFEAQSKLWRLASMAQASGAPVTKWATREVRDGQVHLFFHCVGIRVADQLEKLIWRSVPHVVVTSATLRSLNSFSRLQEMSGLKEKAGDRFVALDSPFNHCEQGKLVIPRMNYEPLIDNEEQHIAEMAAYFREQVESKKYPGMLVLFASGRAMQRFLEHVTDLRLLLLVQGDQPRYRLVETHRKRIDNGERSVLVGLQSFAEGLDLKGDYLTQVHIHKIAFPPIDSPVVITEGEWLKSLNRYPFEVQSLPAASFNLIQQVGRLIRSHGCWGEVVIYDKRLLTKNYGQRLLNALPIFPIEQPEVPEVKKRPAKPSAGRTKSIRAKRRGPTGK
ncbi:ATP-dependent DNA helicase DinG [Enterobacter hormaechei]|uniref:ATP-dependent DNA helicase DinG n=1 Tax=Enterobacter hormaechei TaxID=158836 RepID=UPI002FEF8FA5